ncbi:MAG: aminotransferase class III-fold pyridoxal phosphate-dependent enzyme [Rhodobacteraceae bacterium]|nr:aminotransferase class III-fold pyridoxal phosphate-dependent enzyme [Paracoccaceae bacterium]
MKNAANSQEARDIAYHFHGYTDAAAHPTTGPAIMARGEGIYVWDTNGNRHIEGMAGLWSVAVGFNEKRLINAATRQMSELPYYHNFNHKSHGPAIDLAEKLISLAPVEMDKVFYTNSGSEANDTIVKMLWYRANAMGQPQKKKLIARNRAYHGVTLAAAALTGLSYTRTSFDLPEDRFLHTICPDYWAEGREGESEEEFASRCADDLDQMIISEGPDTIAAFFAEPVMGAGGVVVPPKTYWDKIQKVLAKYDIIFVADEVICGFGRTGEMFGSHTYNLKPDVMTMSKQLTSSYMPFSAFMMNKRFYDPIAEESGRIGVLGHGYTGGGHPVGAAVALENIRIIQEDGLVENARENGAYMIEGLKTFLDHPWAAEVRGVGMVAALQLGPEDHADYSPGTRGNIVNNALAANGLVVRAATDAITFCPPLIIQKPQIDEMISIVGKVLKSIE